ncbi:neuronal acetylcholine receptor subunit alpha-7-like isoform X2 [Bombus vosnesenskii]|uniref:Neuronal acetylcholine receptor subunit alpha-7-like isoform X2 n=3 Tax=Pyrobombus TaxID=144703 RepID=A0A6J3LLN8_9HYME|nr:neuronal acetylcholine receptor subunit alpha-7-like isoform X2 [Bombus impatiens]XP_033204372.1 neuronal acetylcholine receptor subunit alpha-7-like isoform X2 [Bombus vancouverensis nearcticus]XP_033305579.1 neuronal acetylcholine receptor subunit alpha-7-like isoform X2 [Bombus bifarius]XP_033366105.1 neuronal acetylcholine receptor subunit alpha-7-like isoform X2 [Bombus vosnesenskii]XP_050488965.1 neuronal acetylcholine receptor subunit alpha-7-like isoform X2 [Bombus huntii]
MRRWTLMAAIALAASGLVNGGSHEKRLLSDLLDTYNVLERPVGNESEPLVLSFGLTLMQIIDVDEKNQLLITNLWLKLEWNDVNMRWNTSDYGGVRDLRIPPHRLWKPDVLMYNSADEGFDGTYPTNVVVKNNGTCLYVPPGIFKSTCKIDITWFPFDDQRCEMKFGSWTYDGFQLDLQLQDESGGDISSFITNGEWDLLGVPGKRNEIYYNCCPEPYIDITFVVIIRRRTLYYFFNLIVPCVLIASMAVLGFTLPPDSGEKLSLGVTILLSLTVFLNMVAETMPATSDAVPLLGTYFNCIMFMVASSVVSTILILNYHHRNSDTHEMSEWVRVVFLYWLPCVLRMSRPSDKEEREAQKSQKPSPVTGAGKSHGDLELRQRSSKSLLANVLDLEDNALASHNNLLNNVYSTPGPHHHTMGHGHSHIHTTPHHHHSHAATPHHQHSTPLAHSSYPGAIQIGHTPHHHPHPPDTPGPQVETILQNACFCARNELIMILKEIKIITDQLKNEELNTKVTNDWKFAAMVIDRMCLIIFTLFTIIATITVLLSAPHIIVT